MPREEGAALLTLYKYRSLAPAYGRDFIDNVILHNRMWWQSPTSFNDPFDCDPVLVFGENAAERKQFAKRSSRHLVGVPRLARRSKIKEMLRVPKSMREQQTRQAFREWMAESAVSCFSEVKDSPLMWAHYADSHRGVCFEFCEMLQPDPWLAFEVDYTLDRPRVNIAGEDRQEVIKKGILTKSDVWRYEHEYRMVDYRKPPGFRTFPAATLKGIILGASISAEAREFVLGRARQRGGLTVYQASIDESLFRLNINPV